VTFEGRCGQISTETYQKKIKSASTVAQYC